MPVSGVQESFKAPGRAALLNGMFPEISPVKVRHTGYLVCWLVGWSLETGCMYQVAQPNN